VNFPHQTDELRRATANQSTYVENALRHRMVADLCSQLWQRNCNVSLQIFNSEVDNAGFDLVLKLGELIRYVQIKQTHDQKIPPHCSTRITFSKLNGSCIVLISYDWHDLTISGYQFYGKMPHEPMEAIEGYPPSKTPGRRNAEGERHIRSHYRNVPIRQFTPRLDCEQLLDVLFPSYLPTAIIDEDALLELSETWPLNDQICEDVVEVLSNDSDNEELD
jgi:hypothetical protein